MYNQKILVPYFVGIISCAVVVKALYGGPLAIGSESSQAKQVVLASLARIPAPSVRGAGDSVIADAAAKVDPAVVEIHTIGKAIPKSNSPFMDDPMRQFFGMGGGMPQRAEPARGAGSGVIISPDGYIITNNHVVADTQTVTVQVADKSYTAKVVGTDPVTDIAVVKIATDGHPLPVAQLGNSDDLRIGDWAIAVGNPLDIGTTVTLGIISAVNRTGLNAESHPLQSVIQTDAAINPGNSGGALANINGQVIGINEAIYSPTGSYVGIGFAIPINSARKVAAELIRNGKIIHPYLGVAYQPLKFFPADARAQVGVTTKSNNGVVIQQVSPNSPASLAGLKIYDVILEVNKKPINDQNTLDSVIQAGKVGDTLVLLVQRDGHNVIVPVKLQQRPDDFSLEQPQDPTQQDPGQQEIIP